MNRTFRHIVSVLLMLCFIATLVPTSIFHHHEAFLQCHETDVSLEKNPCHVTTFHAISSDTHCEHDFHFTKTFDTCEFCKIVTPRRYYFDLINQNEWDIVPLLILPDFLTGYEYFKISKVSSSVLGRAPPVC